VDRRDRSAPAAGALGAGASDAESPAADVPDTSARAPGRDDPAAEAVFFTDEVPVVGAAVLLGEDAAHHMRVRRLDVGTVVGLRDGQGGVGRGTLVRLTRSAAQVEISAAVQVPPPFPVHLLVPVADRDRMLWLAEKASELGATSWRPVLWKRSRSVAPRGEGVTFTGKVQARMRAALAQSRGAWLPQLFPEATPERAIQAAPTGTRLMLDADGTPLAGPEAPSLDAPVTFAIGPEGGLVPEERAALAEAGFVPVSLGGSVLRFETAALVALGVVRAAGR
jgi:16S rRNA (uracil1498-N3)-methyltransferase